MEEKANEAAKTEKFIIKTDKIEEKNDNSAVVSKNALTLNIDPINSKNQNNPIKPLTSTKSVQFLNRSFEFTSLLKQKT